MGISKYCTFPRCSCTGVCQYSKPAEAEEVCLHPRCSCWSDCGKPKSSRKQCPYCAHRMDAGKRDRYPARSYIVPLSRGGMKVPDNTVVVCETCRNDKRNFTLDEWQTELVWQGDSRAKLVDAFLKLRREANTKDAA